MRKMGKIIVYREDYSNEEKNLECLESEVREIYAVGVYAAEYSAGAKSGSGQLEWNIRE